MSKLKLPVIIVIVLAAAGAGLFLSGVVGGGKDTAPKDKHTIEPIPLAQDFTVNLRDTDVDRFAVINVALQLEPMDDKHYGAFMGLGGGGHGAPAAAPGPPKVAGYPKFADAVIAVTSTFSASELNTPDGKERLKDALRTRFAEIAERDAAEYGAAAEDYHHVGPPFHVMDVYFTKYLVS
jgi:flagellar basal body-associated protein FliL